MNNELIKEQILIYNKDVSETELLSIILGEKAMKCLIADNIYTIKDIDLLTDKEILEYKNIGEETLCKIRSLAKLIKNNSLININKSHVISKPQDIFNLCEDMKLLNQEVLRAFFLNTKNQVIATADIFKGCLNSSIVHPREIFNEAIKRSSASVIVAHNHPSGNSTPSKEDISITKRLKEAGNILGIELLDHVIISKVDCISLKNKGIL